MSRDLSPVLALLPEGGKPVRVHLSRAKGWRMPPNTVKVDRSTRWGNPFLVTRLTGRQWSPGEGWHPRGFEVRYRYEHRGMVFWCHADAVDHAVRCFRVVTAPRLDLAALRGKNLACWCRNGQPCHADVLLELANAP